MLKTMKNQMLPERGEECRCKGKTPKTFMYVCMYVAASRLIYRSSNVNFFFFFFFFFSLIREALDRGSEIAWGRLLSFSYWGARVSPAE